MNSCGSFVTDYLKQLRWDGVVCLDYKLPWVLRWFPGWILCLFLVVLKN